MKIVIKQIKPDGSQYLVYRMTKNNTPMTARIVSSEALGPYVTSINDETITLPTEKLDFLEYIKQDG